MSSYFSYQAENEEPIRALDRRIYRDFQFEQHVHSNLELVYVSQGLLDLTLDGRSMTLQAGKFALVLPWQIHAYESRVPSRCAVVVFAPRFVPLFHPQMAGYATQVFQADEELRSLFVRYLMAEDLPEDCMVSCILTGLCACFGKACPSVPGEKKFVGISSVMRYILDHCTERLTLADAAAALGYSYHHLSHVFNQHTSMSFSRFVSMARLSLATAALRATDEPIADIALRCGFSSIRSFNRVFGEMVGMTPSQYRQKSA